MEKLKKEELDKILEKHRKFLAGESGGRKANLSGLDLRHLDLFGVNFSVADLSYANLSGANLSKADLTGSVLSGAKIIGANLSNADLSGACLHDTNLNGSDLSGAYLLCVDGFRANFCCATFLGADLSGADFACANFTGANLYGADLSSIHVNAKTAGVFPVCPEEGEFVAWKVARLEWGRSCIVKLLIPADAKRSSATTRKCRASKAQVLEIQDVKGREIKNIVAYSTHDETFKYKKGETVTPDVFDEDRWDECSNGIHFFMSRAEAVEY